MLRISLGRLARRLPARGAIAPAAAAGTAQPPAVGQEDWTEVKDEKGGQTYWWNKRTNETTPLGAPKPGPDPWKEVKDASGQTYWWNPETNQTTAVGAPKPPAAGVAPHQAGGAPAAPSAMGGLGGALADGLAWGVGTSVASRMMDGVLGPRQMEMVHRHEGGDAGGSGAAPPPPENPGGDVASQGWAWGDGGSNQSSGGGDDSGGGGGGWFSGGGWDE